MPRRLTESGAAARLEVYRRAKTDREAAVELGIHVTSFRKWRVRQGLPAKALPNGPLADVEEQRRLKVWAESRDVRDAARRLGIDRGAFDSWMRLRGLRSRLALNQPDPDDEGSKHNRYLRAYYQAGSDAEAARLLRVTLQAFSRWRRRNQLPATSKTHKQRLQERRHLRRERAGRT